MALARGGARAAVIANAMDAAPTPVRAEGVQRELLALSGLGFDAAELDLRDYFDGTAHVAAELRRYDVVWLRGGNVFMLRYALARSGADSRLTQLLHDDVGGHRGLPTGGQSIPSGGQHAE